ncbi:hypothetical protein FRC02_010612 [Tulasnella sp. 418]|nr:hypothetical protein FRC02_010612 [Tulasnella sp. 418]
MPVNPFAPPAVLPDGTRQPVLIDPGWVGNLVIEAEGTNEGLADLQARCGDAVMLFPAKTIWKGEGPRPMQGRGIGRSPFRLLRGQSRPGEIWLRCIREKERIG